MELEDFKFELDNNNNALLLGNGFSINFDSGFGNIHSRLYETHKDLIRNGKYNVNSPNINYCKKLKNNYKNILNELKYIEENVFETIFEDAILFAESIICFPKMKGLLVENKTNKNIFNIKIWNAIQNIYHVGSKKGAESVNLEYWTMLIYAHYYIKKNRPDGYTLPTNNFFITLINVGDSKKHSIGEVDILILSSINGLNIYFKMLYSMAIFDKGKAITLKKLDRINLLDLNKIYDLLSKNEVVLTLNYDHIIEKLWSSFRVEHLHGSYKINCNEYSHYLSLSFIHEDEEISISDILIGDHFCNKTFLPVVASTSKGTTDSIKESSDDKIRKCVKEKNINHFVIFGMNINNDIDILRYIMFALEENQIENPSITYCYFNDTEKNEFMEQCNKALPLEKAVVDYCKNINVNYVKTQIILNEYFLR